MIRVLWWRCKKTVEMAICYLELQLDELCKTCVEMAWVILPDTHLQSVVSMPMEEPNNSTLTVSIPVGQAILLSVLLCHAYLQFDCVGWHYFSTCQWISWGVMEISHCRWVGDWMGVCIIVLSIFQSFAVKLSNLVFSTLLSLLSIFHSINIVYYSESHHTKWWWNNVYNRFRSTV